MACACKNKKSNASFTVKNTVRVESNVSTSNNSGRRVVRRILK